MYYTVYCSVCTVCTVLNPKSYSCDKCRETFLLILKKCGVEVVGVEVEDFDIMDAIVTQTTSLSDISVNVKRRFDYELNDANAMEKKLEFCEKRILGLKIKDEDLEGKNDQCVVILGDTASYEIFKKNGNELIKDMFGEKIKEVSSEKISVKTKEGNDALGKEKI